MRAAKDEGVDLGNAQRLQILARGGQQFGPTGDAGFDEFDEPRTHAGVQFDSGVRGERVVIGARSSGGLGTDDADAIGLRRVHGSSRGRDDHLDDGHVITLPGIAQNCGAGRVAGDHQHLHAMGHEVVEAVEGILTHLGDGLGPIRLAGGVAEIEHRLVRKLIKHRSGDREAPEAGVEDPDRSVVHEPTLWDVAVLDAQSGSFGCGGACVGSTPSNRLEIDSPA